MHLGKKSLTFILLSLFCIPGLVWGAAFEVSRGNEPVAEEQSPYDENFDSVFEDPAEDVVIEQPKDINYRDQLEKNEKILVNGDFIIRAGGGFGWVDEALKGYPEGLAGAYSKATISFDARPDPTIRIFGKLKTEMDSDNGSDVWCMPYFDELYCEYNWLDKSFWRLGKFYMTWGQGRLFQPANFMKNSEKGTTLRMTMPNVLDGVSLVAHYRKRTLGSYDDKRLRAGDISYAGHVDKTFGPINLSAAMIYNDLDGQRYSGSFKTVLFKTDLFADFILNHLKDTNRYYKIKFEYPEEIDDYPLGYTKEFLCGFYREWGQTPLWSNAKLYGEYYYDNHLRWDPTHNFGLATNFNNLFGTPIGMSFKWLHSITKDAGQFIGGFSISPWKHVTIRLAIPWQYGDEELDEDFYEEFPIKSKLAFTLFVELSSGF